MGRGRQTPHWTDNANAAFENKQERNSALLCNIKPANYFIFHPYQAPPSPPLSALPCLPPFPLAQRDVFFKPFFLLFFVILYSLLICSFAISSTSSQFEAAALLHLLIFIFSLPVTDVRKQRKKGQSLDLSNGFWLFVCLFVFVHVLICFWTRGPHSCHFYFPLSLLFSSVLSFYTL